MTSWLCELQVEDVPPSNSIRLADDRDHRWRRSRPAFALRDQRRARDASLGFRTDAAQAVRHARELEVAFERLGPKRH